MAKIRKTASIENGLMEIIKVLSEEEIQAAIGKGASYIRKCSNPDLPQQIDHNDSFMLDKACIEKGKAPPLLTAHEYMIAKEFDKIDTHLFIYIFLNCSFPQFLITCFASAKSIVQLKIPISKSLISVSVKLIFLLLTDDVNC